MARKKKHAEHVNHERWLISYADFITLLFAFFVVMFAVSQVDSKKVGRFQESFSLATGANSDEKGDVPRMESDSKPLAASMLPMDELKALEDPRAKAEAEVKNKFPGALAKLEEELGKRQELEASLAGLKVLRRGNDLVLRLDATAIFDSGDDRVRDSARAMLIAIANEVRERKVQLRVEGHTDNQPIKTIRYRSNWDLSTARATSVLVELAERGRLDPKRLAAAGYAEFQPVGDNGTTEGRQMNRRVDFVVSVASEITEWANQGEPTPTSRDTPAPPQAPNPERSMQLPMELDEDTDQTMGRPSGEESAGLADGSSSAKRDGAVARAKVP